MPSEISRINFADPALLARYGSWVRVQVAFYNFLFETAMDMCPEHWKETAEATLAAAREEFRDGTDFYEQSIAAILGKWRSPNDAWRSFVRQK